MGEGDALDTELIVIGAGPAGLSTALYAARMGLEVLVVEKGLAGGLMLEIPLIENYPGFPNGISGQELAKLMVEQAKVHGVAIRELEEAIELDLKGDVKTVKTNKASYEAKAIVIATGCSHRELGVPGEEEFRGRGVSYCGLCDGPLFKGKRVLVVGGGNAAATTALYLSDLASEVLLVHRRDTLRAEEILVKRLAEKGVKFVLNSVLTEIYGDEVVRGVKIRDLKTGEEGELEVDGVFIQVGEVPNSELAAKAGVQVDEGSFIIVDVRQRTNLPGVYAAGDVTNYPVKQVATAVGQGVTAAVEAYGFVKRPYWFR
ncbi:thioredoxin-disulfide reductase [Candidatus Bathyarchaeota archaeon ex4484_135]|nr:MAG: thioredoxin-disulfide reductase [Candidatus Bathyarchaeota archaeon ex4484_135]